MRRSPARVCLTLLPVVLALVLAGGFAAGGGGAVAAPAWAPSATARIHPGTMMYTAGAQCTANFVFADGAGRVYVGYAAHCAGTGAATDTDGCRAASLPLGTKVTFATDGNPATEGTRVGGGTLVYSSWLTMKRLHTAAADPCAYNDLALVRVNAVDVRKVNPSVPFWGGPNGLHSGAVETGDQVYSYGNSSLRGGVEQLSPKVGAGVGDDAADGGWSHPVYTVTPGIPGDSGSGFMDANGRALGVLSTVAIAPLPASNGVGDLAKELAYAKAHSGISGLRLVNGTVKFTPLS
jgi:hypothetical protein